MTRIKPDVLLFGEPVFITAVLHRFKGGSTENFVREWRRSELDSPHYGLVSGVRTLSNGRVNSVGWGEPVEFLHKESFGVYVVNLSPYSNPVYVLPEDAHPAHKQGFLL